MPLADIDRIKALFSQAIDIPDTGARLAWLKRECGGDSELCEEVQSLIEASEEAENRRAAARVEQSRIPERRFGPYVAVDFLARGGASVVYRAERRDGKFEQTVALKVMAAFLSGPDFLRKFETERQLLAALNHPGIAHLLDGGTSAGDPWLAMEYVEGERLDHYCGRHELGVEARLRLFLQVCDAVEYAHRRLIVHRDLKPGNILVTAEGSVKLLDFGTGALLESRNDVTLTRTRMLTPRYASPERLRGEAASVADDVFSLGVILYELLTGAWPFGDPESPADALKRLDGSASAIPPSAAAISESFKIGSLATARFRSLLRGDLSVIALKALEPSVERRYATVAELAADVAACLEARPIQARKDDFAYRLAKMLHRHHVAIAVCALVTILLAGGIGGILWQARVATEQSVRAQARAEDLRKLSNTLLSDLNAAIQNLPGSTEAQRLLVTAVTEHLHRMEQDAAGDSQAQIDLATAYIGLGNVQGNPYDQNMGDATQALVSIGMAIAIVQPLAARQPQNYEAAHTLAWAYQSKAEVLLGIAKPAESAVAMRKAVEIFERLASRPGAGARELVDSATAWGGLGDILGQPGIGSLSDIAGAQATFDRVVAIDQRILQLDPANLRARRGIPTVLMKMANLINETDPPRALDRYRAALAAAEALPPEIRSTVPVQRIIRNDLNHIGTSLEELGKYDEALAQFEKVRAKAANLVAADAKDSRALSDLLDVLEDEADCYIAREQGIFSPDAHPGQDAAAALERLTEIVRFNRSTPTVAEHRAAFGAALVETGIQKRILHRPDDAAGSGAGIRMLEGIALDPSATAIELDHAVEALITAEPASLRRPALAVKAAERMVVLSHRARPTLLLQLAIAYRSAGAPEQAQAAAKEGLRLLARSSNTPFRTRILLEREARSSSRLY
jgi:eukaryotic-like serine/threonine-protein kinase